MNGLRNLALVLERGDNEILVDEAIRQSAVRSLTRMMDFAKSHALITKGKGNA